MSPTGSRKPICTSVFVRGWNRCRRRRSARATILIEIAYDVRAGPGQPVGCAHELGQGAGPHLPHELAAMNLHRHLAQIELGGDLLVRAPDDDKSHDMTLPLVQGGVSLPQIVDERRVPPPFPIALDRRLN